MPHQIPAERLQYVYSRREKNRARAMRWHGMRCKDCGEEDTRCLEFHHTHPELKRFNLAHRWADAWENLELEIRTCILICANCHKRRHHRRPNGGRRYA